MTFTDRLGAGAERPGKPFPKQRIGHRNGFPAALMLATTYPGSPVFPCVALDTVAPVWYTGVSGVPVVGIPFFINRRGKMQVRLIFNPEDGEGASSIARIKFRPSDLIAVKVVARTRGIPMAEFVRTAVMEKMQREAEGVAK